MFACLVSSCFHAPASISDCNSKIQRLHHENIRRALTVIMAGIRGNYGEWLALRGNAAGSGGKLAKLCRRVMYLL